MKRIAAELGGGTMTLYYYVRNKTDIVALMQDAILADVLIADASLPAHWRDAIAAIARRTRQVLMAHPWSMTSLNDAQFGPNAMRHFEQSLAAVAGTGLPVPARFELLATVDGYVFGNALLQTGNFPQLSAIYAESTTAQATESAGPPMTEAALNSQFERGLQALLDGLAARMNIR